MASVLPWGMLSSIATTFAGVRGLACRRRRQNIHAQAEGLLRQTRRNAGNGDIGGSIQFKLAMVEKRWHPHFMQRKWWRRDQRPFTIASAESSASGAFYSQLGHLSGNSGDVSIATGDSAGSAGNIELCAGLATSGGGAVVCSTGSSCGSGGSGEIIVRLVKVILGATRASAAATSSLWQARRPEDSVERLTYMRVGDVGGEIIIKTGRDDMGGRLSSRRKRDKHR